MFHRNDDISFFMSFFNVPMSLGSLFQWIRPVNDRFDLPRLNQLFDGI